MVTYPQVPVVRLTGEDGNAFVIISRVRRAMEHAGLREEAKRFFDEATAQLSYDNLLQFVMRTVRTS